MWGAGRTAVSLTLGENRVVKQGRRKERLINSERALSGVHDVVLRTHTSPLRYRACGIEVTCTPTVTAQGWLYDQDGWDGRAWLVCAEY